MPFLVSSPPQQKSFADQQPIRPFIQCGTRDLNPEALRHMNLNHARLPIPPVPRGTALILVLHHLRLRLTILY